MQFAGLKDLLQKKKKEASSPVAAASAVGSSQPPSTTASASVPPPATHARQDPYAAAIQSALANRSAAADQQSALASSNNNTSSGGRKRSRSSSAEPDRAASGSADTVDSMNEKAHVVPPTPERPPLLTREAFESQRGVMLDALTACLVHCASHSSAPSPPLPRVNDVSCAHNTKTPVPQASATQGEAGEAGRTSVVRIPEAVQQFLTKRYVWQEPEATGGSMAEAAEYEALSGALTELTASSHETRQPRECSAAADGESTEEMAKLLQLIHALWFLTATYWRSAIRGEASLPSAPSPSEAQGTRQSAELAAEFGVIKGWCYSVYLLAAHALPEVMRFTCGRETATCLETWRAQRRSVTGALELLAYLLLDYNSICNGTQGTTSGETGDKEGLVVPPEVRDGLHRMVCDCVQQRRDFTAARQAYTDFTMGNANWKLGLFSAGEVHMRRSVEKLERNRMSHLLNNESAMRLLHAAREVVLAAERSQNSTGSGGDAMLREGFFAAKV